MQYTGDAAIDSQALETSLLGKTQQSFQLQYSYPYLANSSVPPRCADQSTVNSTDDFVNCSSASPGLIGQYIQNMMPNLGIPKAYQAQAASDLTATINVYLQGVTQGWQTPNYHRVYISSSGSPPNWAIDAQFTWTNVPVVDYTKTPVPPATPTMLLRFVGVSYQTKSISLGEPDIIVVDPEEGEEKKTEEKKY